MAYFIKSCIAGTGKFLQVESTYLIGFYFLDSRFSSLNSMAPRSMCSGTRKFFQSLNFSSTFRFPISPNSRSKFCFLRFIGFFNLYSIIFWVFNFFLVRVLLNLLRLYFITAISLSASKFQLLCIRGLSYNYFIHTILDF